MVRSGIIPWRESTKILDRDGKGTQMAMKKAGLLYAARL
jgi:hypothetical protein